MQRSWQWPVVALLLAPAAVSTAQLEGSASSIDLDEARAAFEQLRALSDKDGGALWGVVIGGPMLFVDPATRCVVANAPDAEGALMAGEEGLWTGQLPPQVNVANTAVIWSGVRWAMVMWPLPEDPPQRGILLMHESFHRVQDDLGFKLAMRENGHLDEAKGRIWLRLEWRALATALASDDPIANDALCDALVFRANRHMLSLGAAEQEVDVELNEGLAEYTGVRLSGYSPEDQLRRTVNLLRAYDGASTLSRTFAYPSGPAYGLLLDRARPTWREHIAKARDMAGVLAKAIHFQPDVSDELDVLARASKYEGESVIAAETERQAKRDARVAELRRMFIDGPVLRIPMTSETNFSFSPHGAESLPEVGTVYASMRITAPWGILESGGPVLWVTQGGANQHFRIPAPAEVNAEALDITGENWTLTLEPGWRLKPEARAGNYLLAPAN